MTIRPIRVVKQGFLAVVRRAFSEFLGLPLVVVFGFILLAVAVYFLDDRVQATSPGGLVAWFAAMFGDPGAMSSLLSTIASSIITVTSITFSLLLLAVQQGAATLTSQVYDQFLRRRWNQFQFGFFVGLSVYVLISLATVSAAHRPLFGTLLALVLTAVSLCMVVLLIYNTIDQMRPAAIIGAIHGFVLRSRNASAPLLAGTRRTERRDLACLRDLAAGGDGIVFDIDVARLRQGLREILGDGDAGLEIVFRAAIGTYVAFRDPWISLRSFAPLPEEVRDKVARLTVSCVRLESGRDLTRDPTLGIEQLATIAWTSISTARSNPLPGLLAIRALRDILARWGAEWPLPEDPESPIVYGDRVPGDAFDALEACIVAASESIQAQTLAELVRTLAVLLRHMPPPLAERIADMVSRMLSSLGEHVLTRELQEALQDLGIELARAGHAGTAAALDNAVRALASSVGRLNSRSTRVPG